jgi:hypothetical protein
MHKATTRSWTKVKQQKGQPSLLSSPHGLCALQALEQCELPLLEQSFLCLHLFHAAQHGGDLNKLNNNNIIPSKTPNGNKNLRQTHHTRNTHMASLTKACI